MLMKELLAELSEEYGIPEKIVMEISETPIDDNTLVDPTDMKDRFKHQFIQSLDFEWFDLIFQAKYVGLKAADIRKFLQEGVIDIEGEEQT